MSATHDASLFADAQAALREANIAFAESHPGEGPGRQPVHTVYGGAQLFAADSVPKLGAIALRAMNQYMADSATLGVDGGVFSVVVSARNRTSHPVYLALPVSNGISVAPFAFEIRGLSAPAAAIGGILNLSDPSVTTFAAGETKRQYFDFNIGSVVRNRTIAPAAYRFTGWYATRSVALSPIVIGPP